MALRGYIAERPLFLSVKFASNRLLTGFKNFIQIRADCGLQQRIFIVPAFYVRHEISTRVAAERDFAASFRAGANRIQLKLEQRLQHRVRITPAADQIADRNQRWRPDCARFRKAGDAFFIQIRAVLNGIHAGFDRILHCLRTVCVRHDRKT